MESVGQPFGNLPITNPSHAQNAQSSLPSARETQKGHDSQKDIVEALPGHDLSHDDPRFNPVRELLSIFNGGQYMKREKVVCLFRDFSQPYNLSPIRPYTRSLSVIYYFLLHHLHELSNFLHARQQELAPNEQEYQSQNAQNDISDNQFESSSENCNDNLHAISPISSSGNSNAFPNDNNDDQNYINQNDNIPLPGDNDAVQKGDFQPLDAATSSYWVSFLLDDYPDYPILNTIANDYEYLY